MLNLSSSTTLLLLVSSGVSAFTPLATNSKARQMLTQPVFTPTNIQSKTTTTTKTSSSSSSSPSMTALSASPSDLDVIALVAGQENYGLAVVLLGEGLYSFAQAPSTANLRVLVPPAIAAVILVAVAGPLITSGDVSSVGTGLWVATAVSALMIASYVLRLTAPFALVPKEVAFAGLLVAVAGFFSFGQNLVVDGFVTLPSIPLPGLPMPPSDIDLDRGVYFG